MCWDPSSQSSKSAADHLKPRKPNAANHEPHGSQFNVQEQLYRHYLSIPKLAQVRESPQAIAVGSFVLGAVLSLGSRKIYVRYFKRIPSAGWVTPDIVEQRRWLKGVVTSVGDGDGFRLYHTPSFGWTRPFKFRRVPTSSKELKDLTISVRLAAVDAPEIGRFGKENQPYAHEALEWLRNDLLGKTVYCQVEAQDRFIRVVAMPFHSPKVLPGIIARGKCVSMELLRAGLAVTYKEAGACYGDFGKEEFLRVEEQARKARKGMWKDGEASVETPAEYKRRHAEGLPSSVDEEDTAIRSKPSRRKRVFTPIIEK